MNENWRKASRSWANGDCVEVTSWRKASCSVNNGACIEVGSAPAVVAVQDSVNRENVMLTFPAAAWEAFTSSLK